MSGAANLLRERNVLVFDLDGTLVDSAADIRGTLDLALRDCGIVGVGDEDTIDLFSPLPAIVSDALERRRVPVDHRDAVVGAYRSWLSRSSYERSVPYAGVKDFLADRQQRGQRLAVCTNKAHAEALRMLSHFGLLDFFQCVVGSDSAAAPKPDAAPLDMVLRHFQAAPAQAVLVGDTHVDALCARNAGVDFVWHRPGYGDTAHMAGLSVAAFDSWDSLLPGCAAPCEVLTAAM